MKRMNGVCVSQACFFTDFPAIQDNGVSLILSLEEKCLSLGRKSLSLEKKIQEFMPKILQFMTPVTLGCLCLSHLKFIRGIKAYI